MVIGYILAIVGAIASFSVWGVISSETGRGWGYYTYTPPYTDHETTMILLFIICLVVTAAGILMIIFSVMKKSNQDSLQRLQNMQGGGQKHGVCPNCGLNLAEGSDKCPQCGTRIRED